MRYKFLILFLISVEFAFSVSQDSIGVVEQKGKKYILHLVGKETLFSISRKYGTNLNELKNLNPELAQGLKMGQKLMIPIKEKVQITQTNLVAPQNENYVLHQVESSQTLYAISKKYNAKIDDIKRWNSLESNELKVGSYIIVGEKNKAEIVENTTQKNESIEQKIEKTEPEIVQKSSIKKSEDGKISEKVSATVFETQDGNKFFFALHKTAPIGSILKVSNQQNSNSIFVRVSGKQNENGIKLSKIAYEKLELSANSNVIVEYFVP